MNRDRLKNQNGVALVFALLIVLVLTLIGINAISTTTFETNIAGNERLYNKAFYTSDAGVDYFFGYGGLLYFDSQPIGVVDSRAEGLSLGNDYFLVNWERSLQILAPPKNMNLRSPRRGYLQIFLQQEE